MRAFIAFLVGLSISGSTFLWAQSLGEVAEKEKERRKGKPEGKVITDTDLGRAKGSTMSNTDSSSTDPSTTTGSTTSGSTAPSAAAGKKEKTEDEVRDDKQKDWRDRMEKANAEVTRLQKAVADSQGYGAYSNPAAVKQLEDAQAQLQAAQAAVATLEEERRANGYQ
jgi:hypothetical protein